MGEYCNRPNGYEEKIFKSLHLIDELDILIHLGDICIGRDEYWNNRFCYTSPLTKKILVRGNHDKKSLSWYSEHGWSFICDHFSLETNGKKILFSHEPMVYDKSLYDLNIHGHLHEKIHHNPVLPEDRKYKLVSLELMGYRAFSLEELLTCG
jgi:calcineurin-like phosphoesterase family protein